MSTLPKPRPLLGEMHDYGQSKTRLRTSVVGLVRPASAHGAGGGGVGGGGGGERGGVSSLSSSPHHCALNMGFPLTAAEVKVRVLLRYMAMTLAHSPVLVCGETVRSRLIRGRNGPSCVVFASFPLTQL